MLEDSITKAKKTGIDTIKLVWEFFTDEIPHVLSNWRFEIKKHFDISKNSFFPKPKINSSLLSFKPKINDQFNLKNPKNLEKITRVLFSNRRKMINKNFNKLFGKQKSISKNLNINLNKRPEELSNETFYKIAIQYEKLFD